MGVIVKLGWRIGKCFFLLNQFIYFICRSFCSISRVVSQRQRLLLYRQHEQRNFYAILDREFYTHRQIDPHRLRDVNVLTSCLKCIYTELPQFCGPNNVVGGFAAVFYVKLAQALRAHAPMRNVYIIQARLACKRIFVQPLAGKRGARTFYRKQNRLRIFSSRERSCGDLECNWTRSWNLALHRRPLISIKATGR